MHPQYKLFDIEDVGAKGGIDEVRKAMAPSRKKIFVIGAGASQSAGIKTYEDPRGLIKKAGGRSNMSETVFMTEETTKKYLDIVKGMVDQVSRAAPTSFHVMLNKLAQRGDNMTIYTQNIDGLEERLPWLSASAPLPNRKFPNVVPLHGSLHKMGCQTCSYTAPMQIWLFMDGSCPPCPNCPRNDVPDHPERKRNKLPRPNSKKHDILRPLILLYDCPEDTWKALNYDDIRRYDQQIEPPTTVIVAGTRLGVGGARGLAMDLCDSAHHHSPASITLWINLADVPEGMHDKFDYAIKGTCDQFAETFSI